MHLQAKHETNSTEHSPTWKADCQLASEGIPYILWNQIAQ